ncbi:Asp23/Gls24 family envelope stress response protein [Jatrophihabitans endophyticus]|uniref:Asp23/Gls24 family envelope stress response protein n=1 Tax=Jatrophihabitans endophyticus TaxID=1206085 RepID=UPI0019FD36CF|nr:Asp23/Gls24 family envelope stress response protein [Jatrophihabitans endophyticus]MBE7189149.1 Asp23/Gls24 family envelope stress response protein [Jatrophihabitans endophyticus]
MTSTSKSDTEAATAVQPAAAAESGSTELVTSELITDEGRTVVADVVVEKIASIAAREITGVHRMGSGAARALGAVRERIPGARAATGPGVSVEVGERQAAVDLALVMEYGAEVGDLSRAVRANVIGSIERMTSLEVTEVNINILDVFVPGDEEEPADPRVR